MAHGFQIRLEGQTLAISGDCTFPQSPGLHREIAAVLKDGAGPRRVRVDLTRTTALDGSLLAVLLEAKERLQSVDRDLVLCEPGELAGSLVKTAKAEVLTQEK